MSALLQMFALVVLTFLILAVLAIRYLGVLGFLLVAVMFVFCLSLLQRLIGKTLRKFFLAPFLAKGSVLHDAEVRVRSVTPATSPVHEIHADEADPEVFEATDEEGPRDWYLLDVTITPREANGTFTLWEPGELTLVAPDAQPADINEEGSTLGQVHAVEVWQDGRWHPDDGGKYEGPQRLKLLVAVQPNEHRLRFRYYFETFGEIEIPAGLSGA